MGTKDDVASPLPYLWALGYVLILGTVFLKVEWPLQDTYVHLVKPALLSWPDAVRDAFTRGVEYRPFFTLGIKLSYEAVGASLGFFQGLVLLQFAALLGLVVWLCRPVGTARALAACVAVSCVCGLHTSRILFGFWPLNHHSAVMVLLLLMIALACHAPMRRVDWVFGLLAVTGMFGLELGVLAIPLMLILWWFGAPGIGRRGVVAVLCAAAVYAAVRLMFSQPHQDELAIYADSGFLFRALSASELKARFGATPWILWAYNLVANFLTVVASEPRDGVYAFVESLLAHDMEPWQWFHVGVSVLTSAFILGSLLWLRSWRGRDRMLVVIGCSLLACGTAIGFLYARDRLGLSGGIGYALLLYVAVAGWQEHAPPPVWLRRAALALAAVVAFLWVVRSGELYFQLRDTAWDFHNEWTQRYDELGAAERGETAILDKMRTEALAKTPADPRRDPAWTYALFERRFHPIARTP